MFILRSRAWLLAGMFAALPTPSIAQEVGDDFESGGFGAFWSAETGVAVTHSSAHRGLYGMQALEDGGAVAVAYAQAPLSGGSEAYLRFWMIDLHQDGGSGRFAVAELNAQKPMTVLALAELDLVLDAGAASVELIENTPRGSMATSAVPISGPGVNWHLYQLGLVGVGSDAGGAMLWLDGSQVAIGPAVDLSGFSLATLAVGTPFVYGSAHAGVLSFDDVRVSTRPTATTLAIAGPASAPVGACEPLETLLLDTSQASAPAPYAFQVSLLDAIGGSTVYGDSSCATVLSAQSWSVGQTTAPAWFTLNGTLGAVILTSEADFLSPLLYVSAGDGGSPDAGFFSDAGASGDGGQPATDGGKNEGANDGGSSGADGGPSTAPTPDGGVNSFSSYRVGCESTGAPSPGAPWVALLMLVLNRVSARFGVRRLPS